MSLQCVLRALMKSLVGGPQPLVCWLHTFIFMWPWGEAGCFGCTWETTQPHRAHHRSLTSLSSRSHQLLCWLRTFQSVLTNDQISIQTKRFELNSSDKITFVKMRSFITVLNVRSKIYFLKTRLCNLKRLTA